MYSAWGDGHIPMYSVLSPITAFSDIYAAALVVDTVGICKGLVSVKYSTVLFNIVWLSYIKNTNHRRRRYRFVFFFPSMSLAVLRLPWHVLV